MEGEGSQQLFGVRENGFGGAFDRSKSRRGGSLHSHDHLLSTEQGIADEFARAQRYGLLGHVCRFCCSVSEDSGLGRCAYIYLWRVYGSILG